MSRVSVVGGGLYGCVAAVELAREGHEVDLYERHADLLHGASRCNQGRIHRGFHYPRSRNTASEAAEAAPRFEARYARAIDRSVDHYYAIADDSSTLTGPGEYLAFLERTGLTYWPEHPSWLRDCAVCVRAEESFVNLDVLRDLLWRELAQAHVRVRLATPVEDLRVDGMGSEVVRATYGTGWVQPLQWEVVEIALFRLPVALRRTSLVVMDGPFSSIDPLPGGLHMVYDVRVSVHARNVGLAPAIPPALHALLDRGPLYTTLSRHKTLQAGAALYMRGVEDADYQGSMFTVRAVLPNTDATDERPFRVLAGPGGLQLLPGKLASCLSAADILVGLCRVSV